MSVFLSFESIILFPFYNNAKITQMATGLAMSQLVFFFLEEKTGSEEATTVNARRQKHIQG